MTTTPERINIRPGVTVLSVLRHLNYRPWYAIAEFVDNSLQSFLDWREQLERVDGRPAKLRVVIELEPVDGGRISIRDNAAGIHEADYPRAFRPAEVPPDRTGLSEFGMGMKSAACWLARTWTVRTSALGEPVERTVVFDIDRIVQDRVEELEVKTEPTSPNTHFTEIVLSNLHRPLVGRTLGKVKEHLASIYRVFIRTGVLELTLDGQMLTYPEPKILSVAFYKTTRAEPVLWRKELDFDFGLGLRAHGFAALRETGSTSGAGFALFRRNRLIQGSADEGYRPEVVFGKSNSFTYQRLFGELHLDGFEVSHTKDGFRWDENEDTFLALLKEKLNEAPLRLLDQAEEYRVRRKPDELKPGAEEASQRTAEVIEREVPPVLEREIEMKPEIQDPPPALPASVTLAKREINVELHGSSWRINLELSDDPAVGEWLSVSDQAPVEGNGKGAKVRCIGVRLSLAHPFMERFGGSEPSRIEPLLRVAAAIALAETAARDSGVKMAGIIRRNMNELLRDALSKP